jgi:hypothetical protein
LEKLKTRELEKASKEAAADKQFEGIAIKLLSMVFSEMQAFANELVRQRINGWYRNGACDRDYSAPVSLIVFCL